MASKAPTPAATAAAKKRPGSRWRKLLIALALLVALYAVVCVTRARERLVVALASRELSATVTVGKVDFAWPLAVVVRDVAVVLPGASAPFLKIPRLEFDFELAPPRLATVVVEDAVLVLRERSDGSFELPAVRPAEAPAGRPPSVTVTRARVELAGEGPLHARLEGVVASGFPRTAAVDSLTLTPQNDGSFDLRGGVDFGDAAHVRVGARGSDGTLERVTVRVSETRPLALESLRKLTAPAVADWLSRNAIRGDVAGEARLLFRGAAAAAGPSPAPSTPRFEADVDLLDVALAPEVFPTTVEGLRGRLEFRGRDLHIPGLLGRHPPGAVRISGDVTDLPGAHAAHLVARIDSALVDDELRRALDEDKVGKVVNDALAPEGRYSVTATVDGKAGTPPHVALDLELEDNALLFHGFLAPDGRRHGMPIRVESVRGRVLASPDASSYDRVTGFTRGGARVESTARMTIDRITGTVSAFDVPVDEELIAAAEKEVGPVVRRMVDLLALEGTFDAVAQFDVQHALDLVIEAHPKLLKLAPVVFPYALLCDGGKLVFEKERLRFDDVRGGAGDLNLRVRGFIGIDSADAPIDLTIEAHDLPLDEKLLVAARALPDKRMAETLERLKPSGHVDLLVAWKRPKAGAPTEITIEIVPENVRFEALDGALVVTSVRGAVTMRRVGDGPWQLELVRGGGISARALGGGIALSGQITDAPESASSLRLLGRRIRIDDDFVTAVRALAPEIADVIESHKVRGRLSVECDLAPVNGRLEPTRVDVVPDMAPVGGESTEPADDGIAADPPWLSLPLVWTSGAMHADLGAGTVTFDRLAGRVGSAALRATDGTFKFDASGLDVDVGLLADGLTFAETTELVLGPVLGAEKRKAMAPYGPLGITRANVRSLKFHVPRGGELVDRIDAEGTVDLDGWTLYTSGALKDLSGRVAIASLHYERTGHGIDDVRADGKLEGITIDLGGMRFSNVQSDLLLAEGRLSVPWLSAEFAGGRLLRDRNHLGITLKDEMPFDGRLELLAADVSRLLGDDVPRMRGLAGRVDADVGFRGRGRSLIRGQGLTSLEAAGSVEVHDAKLWTIPVFDKLYSKAVLPLTGTSADEVDLKESGAGKAEPPKWARGRFEFALQGVYVRLSRIEFEGEPLVLRGEGTLGPERLSMHFFPEVKAGVGWLRGIPIVGPVIGFVLSSIEHELGAFRFQGPYGNPDVEWDPVTLVPRPDLVIPLERPRTAAPSQEARPVRF